MAPDPFDLRDRVRLNGDGTFEFEFKLVESADANENYAKSFGDYKITVSEHFGDASTYFKVVENPDSFIDQRTLLGLSSDKSDYVLGSSIIITGKILDYDFNPSDNIRNTVTLTFANPDGQTLTFEDHQQKTGYTNCYTNDCSIYSKPLEYTAMPDLVGGFQIDAILNPLQFGYGVYTVTAVHDLTKVSESLQFEIKSALSDVVPETEPEDPLVMQLCKSTRAHVDEILKDLRSIGKGENKPTMESVDCSENQTFNVGEKLVVIGKVIPKNPTSLDQSSTKTSGQTQQGHSYSTNYAQATMNYVEVSIPYPRSMIVTESAAWKTTPNEGENYTGGGGSGGGGVMHGGSDGGGVGTNEKEESERHTGYDGTAVLQKQKRLLTDMNYKAYPDEDGNFATVFELRPGIFASGTYAVKASYFGYYDETTARVFDNLSLIHI